MSATVDDLSYADRALIALGNEFGWHYLGCQRCENTTAWDARFVRRSRNGLRLQIDDRALRSLDELAKTLDAAL